MTSAVTRWVVTPRRLWAAAYVGVINPRVQQRLPLITELAQSLGLIRDLTDGLYTRLMDMIAERFPETQVQSTLRSRIAYVMQRAEQSERGSELVDQAVELIRAAAADLPSDEVGGHGTQFKLALAMKIIKAFSADYEKAVQVLTCGYGLKEMDFESLAQAAQAARDKIANLKGHIGSWAGMVQASAENEADAYRIARISAERYDWVYVGYSRETGDWCVFYNHRKGR